MDKVRWLRRGTAACLLLAAATACAQPGDAQAVVQARKDYAQAMQGHDVGLQNAMRAELAAQLAMSRKRAAHRPLASKPATRADGKQHADAAAPGPRPDAGKPESQSIHYGQH